MTKNPPPFFFVFLCAVASALLLAGCHAAPEKYRVSGIGPDAASSGDPAVFWEAGTASADPAVYYWEAGTASAGFPASGKKAAIVDFTVEYVTTELEGPGDKQPKLGGVEFSTYGFVLTLFGVGKKQVVYDDKFKEELPARMYAIFTKELSSRGVEVLPVETVTAAAAYARLRTVKPGSASAAQFFNIKGSDTGNPKRIEVHPAPGLVTIKNGASKGDLSLEREILAETGADVAVRAHFRVGVWRGAATVEHGSRIDFVSAAGSSTVTAVKSLISDDSCCDSDAVKVFRGRVYQVNSEKYLAGINEIAPPFAGMGLDAASRGRETSKKGS